MYLPFGEGKHAPVAASDIARVVVTMLIDSQPHVGQRYAITGSKNMNMLEVAQVLSNELGKKVEYVDLPLDYWRKALTQQPEFSEYLADHLVHVARDHLDGVFSVQNDLVEQLGGRPPQSVEDFVRTHIGYFTA